MHRGDNRRANELTPPTLIGTSAALTHAAARAMRAAAGSAKVLITGESGVGKDVLARFIHAHSPRRGRPFVALNCAGLTESLLESELFGHVKGSFTGAYRDKAGSIEQADGGTIFLDEIGDMGPRLQGLLLRFLETGEVRRVGSDEAPTRVNVRVISATHRDLMGMVAAGTFRDDLFYRINVVHVTVPPLRERVEDIPALLRHFVAESGVALAFREDALRLLERYAWPGNVRELHNVVEQLASLVGGGTVEPADLPLAIASHTRSPRADRRRALADDLFEGLTTGRIHFWDDVYVLFMHRDLTRADLLRLVNRGLAASPGGYRGLLRLFGLPQDQYKRLLNFLAAHDCVVESRRFRARAATGDPVAAVRARARIG